MNPTEVPLELFRSLRRLPALRPASPPHLFKKKDLLVEQEGEQRAEQGAEQREEREAEEEKGRRGSSPPLEVRTVLK